MINSRLITFFKKNLLRKVLFAILMLAIYRIVICIKIPFIFIDHSILAFPNSSNFLSNIIFGAVMNSFSILSVNIWPYVLSNLIVGILDLFVFKICNYRKGVINCVYIFFASLTSVYLCKTLISCNVVATSKALFYLISILLLVLGSYFCKLILESIIAIELFSDRLVEVRKSKTILYFILFNVFLYSIFIFKFYYN